MPNDANVTGNPAASGTGPDPADELNGDGNEPQYDVDEYGNPIDADGNLLDLSGQGGEPQQQDDQTQGGAPSPAPGAMQQDPQAAAAAQQAPAGRPAPRPYAPAMQTGQGTDADRARLKAAIESWDSEQMLGAVQEVVDRRVNAAINNYLATEARVAPNPIEAIARKNLYAAAQQDPTILQNPEAMDLALASAAMEYGYQTGDVWGAMQQAQALRQQNRQLASAPGMQPAPPQTNQQRQQQAGAQPRTETGQFAAQAPQQRTPAPGMGGRGAMRPAQQATGTIGLLQKTMPWAKARDLRDMAEDRR